MNVRKIIIVIVYKDRLFFLNLVSWENMYQFSLIFFVFMNNVDATTYNTYKIIEI